MRSMREACGLKLQRRLFILGEFILGLSLFRRRGAVL